MHVFFFFKQKTAYELRISDWSSDVCSSDLFLRAYACAGRRRCRAAAPVRCDHLGAPRSVGQEPGWRFDVHETAAGREGGPARAEREQVAVQKRRSEERRGGKERGRKCRSRWSAYH